MLKSLKKLFAQPHDLAQPNHSSANRRAVNIEGLEGRILLTAAPRVTGVVADNRGEVTISLSRTVTGVGKSSVKLFTPGADGIIGTVDDIRQPSQVVYTPSNGRITIKGKLAANTAYRVRVQSQLVKSLDGRKLDGEFTGTFPSGDGHPGGNFSFQIKNDKSTHPTMRMSTSEGVMNISMDGTNTPVSVANFINYANTGRYDSSFITRNVPGFIIQGGSMVVNKNDQMVDTTTDPAIINEYKKGTTLEPTRGTIAFAKLGTDPNSATNQFFFNLTDNSSTLDSQNAGFTSFGTISNPSGLAAMDAIAGLNVVALQNPATGHGVSATVLPKTPTATGLTNTPVIVDKSTFTGATETVDPNTGEQEFVVTGPFDPKADLVIIRRVAVLDKVIPLA